MNNPKPALNSTSAPLLIRWRGRQQGPYPLAIIEQKLAANEIGLLHEVYYNGSWVTLRDYLNEQEAIQRAERLAQEEADRRAREAEERKAKEREESQRAAALAEERRKNDLLASTMQSQQSGDHQPLSAAPRQSPSGGSLPLRGLGLLLLLAGGVMTFYFFLIFDPSVQSGLGGRIVNLGLMADRQNGVVVGIGIGIVGAIMVVLGNRNRN